MLLFYCRKTSKAPQGMRLRQQWQGNHVIVYAQQVCKLCTQMNRQMQKLLYQLHTPGWLNQSHLIIKQLMDSSECHPKKWQHPTLVILHGHACTRDLSTTLWLWCHGNRHPSKLNFQYPPYKHCHQQHPFMKQRSKFLLNGLKLLTPYSCVTCSLLAAFGSGPATAL